MMMNEAADLYGRETPKRSTRISENVKEIKQRMLTYRETNVEFLCEIPSVKCTSNGISQTRFDTPYVYPLQIIFDNVEYNNGGQPRSSCDPCHCLQLGDVPVIYLSAWLCK